MELLEFIFSSFWTFSGTIVLLLVLSVFIPRFKFHWKSDPKDKPKANPVKDRINKYTNAVGLAKEIKEKGGDA